MAYWRLYSLLFFLLVPAHAQSGPAVRVLDQATVTISASVTPPGSVPEAPIALPDDWHDTSSTLPDQRWYHLTFDDGGWSLPTIYVERVCTNLEVWINGQLWAAGA